jgi:hypothetical protein
MALRGDWRFERSATALGFERVLAAEAAFFRDDRSARELSRGVSAEAAGAVFAGVDAVLSAGGEGFGVAGDAGGAADWLGEGALV